MRVLIVEDDEIEAEVLQFSLGEFGYEVTVASDGREAFDLIRTGLYQLVVSDWEMPEMTGVQLCREIRRRHFSGYVYVILLTSRAGTHNVVEGLNAGADDFVNKPFEVEELRVRLRVAERLLALESRDVTIFSLAKLADSRDPETGAHLERMREYCRILAEHLSHTEKFRDRIDGDYVKLIYLTSPLHDIGKVGVPDRVLLKPGKLSWDEFEIMKQHAAIGAQTLDAAAQAYPEAQFLSMARDIAWSHHERFDGTGYPRRLAGEAIPLCGRIVAVADVYDALTTKRVYKPAFDHETAREIIVDESGRQFDPEIVDAFLACEEQFLAIRRRFDERDEQPDDAHEYELAVAAHA